MKYIERSSYLDRLIGLQGTPDIKIITGIRRCGKSELMQAYIRYLRASSKNSNIILIDYYNLDFEGLKDYKSLNKYVNEHYIEGADNYLFIDEVQLCPQFELAINSLHNSRKYDIYLTGSNAFLLSSDLTTLFTGRFIEIPVFPFSFQEFCTYFDGTQDKRSLFEDYLKKGGLAGSYEYNNEIDRIAYIRDVYTTIINQDIKKKYNLPDTGVLEHLTEFLMDNVANLTSPNKISDTLTSNVLATNHVTIQKYIKCLCKAFMFYDVKRYNIKGKRYLETADKYYLNDLGMRNAVLGTRNVDMGRVCENVVAMELIRRGYEVYVGKLYQKEVDFVAIRHNEKIYIQVSDIITENSTFMREVTPLLQIRDAYPKFLLANTQHFEYQYEGIRIINIADWLLNKI